MDKKNWKKIANMWITERCVKLLLRALYKLSGSTSPCAFNAEVEKKSAFSFQIEQFLIDFSKKKNF